MADLDLTEAVEAAARALYQDAYPGATYTHADHERCLESDYAVWPSRARVVVAAVAPILAAQARREALEGLAERMRADAWKLGHLAAEAEDNGIRHVFGVREVVAVPREVGSSQGDKAAVRAWADEQRPGIDNFVRLTNHGWEAIYRTWSYTATQLAAKAEGVRLALGYVEELR